jgi:flagellar hook-associated protein 3 FlgL
MRVSAQTRHDQTLRALALVAERMDLVQTQLATGKRIQKVSDDPAGVASALGYRNSIAFETQMRRNIDSAISVLDITESALNSVTESVQRVRELSVQAANGVLGTSERQAIAAEVDQLLLSMVQSANTNFGGQYIFSGHQTQTPAYAVTGNPPTAVAFQGDNGIMERQISGADKVQTNIPGPDVFGTLFEDMIALRDALTSSAPASDIQAGITAMDGALDRVLAARSAMGARTQRLEATLEHSLDIDLNLTNLKSNVEDIDLAEGIVALNAQQNALQATLGAIGRTAGMTLLDFLR